MELKHMNAQQGREVYTFVDCYGKDCIIHTTHFQDENKLWLGVIKPEIIVFDTQDDALVHDKYIRSEMPSNWVIDDHLHLTQEQVRKLLPLLNKFAETGEFK